MSEQKKPIIVLGMHRSGTSCLAGSLHESGVYFGDVSIKNEFNKKGNRENNDIMSINDDILNYSGGSWENPPNQVIWTREQEELGFKVIKKLQESCGNTVWGFKDPRTLLTFPFWKKILPAHNLVGTVRSPYNVAISLQKRDDKFTLKKSYNLWLHYNELLLKIIKNEHFPLISFDLTSKEYEHKLGVIKKYLSLPVNESDLFFDNSLRSQNTTPKQYNNSEIESCYIQLQKKLF